MLFDMEADPPNPEGLPSVSVDLEVLADALETDPLTAGGLLDLDTGEVWPQGVIDAMSESEGWDPDEEIEHWLRIDALGSHAAYQDMCEFIDTLPDQRLAELLTVAVRGPGAFRRFKDVLSERPDLLEEYFTFARARKIERAAAWLAENGYAAELR